MTFRSTKTYGHEIGLSSCFRQWRAKSHCNKLHGYALSIKFEFEATELDENHWVVDFGGLKKLRAKLENYFDHKTLVAKDDPDMDWFIEAQKRGIADLIVMDEIGCEKFAEFAYGLACEWLREAEYANSYKPRCRVVSAEVREHGANSAIYLGKGN